MENYKQKTPITLFVQPEKLQRSANLMPPVSAIWLLNRGSYIVKFEIDGYFATEKGIKYLQDSIARFIQTYGENAVKLAIPPRRTPDIERDKIIHLSEFSSNLDNLKQKIANKAPLNIELMDETFWSMKLWMERQLSQNRIPTENELETVGTAYSPHKERSTIRAKARSIYRWYALRGFEPTRDTRKRFKGAKPMTRKEAARIARKALQDDRRSRVERGLMILQLENKKTTVRSLAQVAGVAKDTAAKYLRELRAKGAI
ncbi:MAG TPA: hypothetical protein EYH20_05650 [Leucothrix sp.]|nr:hypothetical protein [Leucothrix sp.]